MWCDPVKANINQKLLKWERLAINCIGIIGKSQIKGEVRKEKVVE